MDNPSSPLDTLRQLKEMLDAGALTPTEFEALKKRLVFNAPTGVPPAPAPVALAPPAAEPPAPPLASEPPGFPTPPEIVVLPSPAMGPGSSPPVAPPPVMAETFSSLLAPAIAESDGGAPFIVPVEPTVAEPVYRQEPPAAPGWVDNEFAEAEAPRARSPLALVLSIGGLLALLGLVLYLSLNRRPSEHLTSTSQTAADSLAAPIEAGPQARQLPPISTAPETIRVVPTNPAPASPARPVPTARYADSAAGPAPASAPDSAAR